MSRLFSELNDIYLNAMLPNHSQPTPGPTLTHPPHEAPTPHKAIVKDTKDGTPKEDSSGFACFLRDHRAEIEKEFPGSGKRELRLLGWEIWKELSPKEKEAYCRVGRDRKSRKEAQYSNGKEVKSKKQWREEKAEGNKRNQSDSL